MSGRDIPEGVTRFDAVGEDLSALRRGKRLAALRLNESRGFARLRP